MLGLCHFDRMLYTTEMRYGTGSQEFTYRVAVYSIADQDNVTLLDTLDLDSAGYPSVDHKSGQVYIPCDSGVYVVKCDGVKLSHVTTLSCVGSLCGVAVVSSDTLYVCKGSEWFQCDTPYLVDVSQDRVTGKLKSLQEMSRAGCPGDVAVLGDTVLVQYGNCTLVLYPHGIQGAGQLLRLPPYMRVVGGLTTDHHSNFLMVAPEDHYVHVLDITGKLTHNIPIPRNNSNKEPQVCTVVEGQVWVGYDNGDILVMSSPQ